MVVPTIEKGRASPTPTSGWCGGGSTCPPRPTLPRFVIGRFAENDEEICGRTAAFPRLGRTTNERLPFQISNLKIEIAGERPSRDYLDKRSPARSHRVARPLTGLKYDSKFQIQKSRSDIQDQGYRPRSVVASATRLMPSMLAAVRMLTLRSRWIFSTSAKLFFITRSRRL